MKLFKPIAIGKMKLRNRIVMSPIGTVYGENGHVTKRMIDFYRRRAQGGVGLIIVEITVVDSSGAYNPNFLRIDDDQYIEGLSRLAQQINSFGAKTSIEIFHPGRQATSRLTGIQPVAPSSIPHPLFRETPKELTRKEIEILIHQFVKAARRVKEAGFDSVEIHGAAGQLIHQFFSHLSNKRTDEYGGDLSGRARFGIEIVRGVRKIVGKDFPIIFRISADECEKGGLTLKETRQIVQKIEEAGADAVDVIAGTYASFLCLIPPMNKPRGCNVQFAEEVKKVISIPVIASGRINDPFLAEQILSEKKADLIGMARGLICDPDFAKKTLEERTEEIRKCIACNTCIDGIMFEGSSLKCAINAEVGREKEFEIHPVSEKKRIFIIGGGPGGMEVARILSLKGHDTTIYEKKDRLGGNFNFAFLPPDKREFKEIISYLSGQMTKLNVRVLLNQEANFELVHARKPDVVIIATGATPIVPDIPGIDGKNVFLATEILNGGAKLGQKIAVIGGGLVGCETALFLAKDKRDLIIIEMLEKWGRDISWSMKNLVLRPILKEHHVDIMTSTECVEIKNDGIIVKQNEEIKFIAADMVVIACGFKANNDLYNKLRNENLQIFNIGDCKEPRKLINAIHEGASTALTI